MAAPIALALTGTWTSRRCSAFLSSCDDDDPDSERRLGYQDRPDATRARDQRGYAGILPSIYGFRSTSGATISKKHLLGIQHYTLHDRRVDPHVVLETFREADQHIAVIKLT